MYWLFCDYVLLSLFVFVRCMRAWCLTSYKICNSSFTARRFWLVDLSLNVWILFCVVVLLLWFCYLGLILFLFKLKWFVRVCFVLILCIDFVTTVRVFKIRMLLLCVLGCFVLLLLFLVLVCIWNMSLSLIIVCVIVIVMIMMIAIALLSKNVVAMFRIRYSRRRFDGVKSFLLRLMFCYGYCCFYVMWCMLSVGYLIFLKL